MIKVSILAIGSEILDGRVQDTNSSFIAERLSEHGIKPGMFLICDDDVKEIVSCLSYLSAFSDFILVSGGLGPTTDDVTREAVAKFMGKKLLFSEEEYGRLKAFFLSRKRTLSPSLERQAMVPEAAAFIPNPVGTASGFIVDANEKPTCVCVPGVPKELYPMFDTHVLPLILSKGGREKVSYRLLRTFGLGESQVGDRVETLELPDSIFVSYRATFPEVQVKLKSTDTRELDEAAERVKAAIGQEHVFSETLDQTLERVVHSRLIEKKLTVAVAESCTGGMLGMLLSSEPGASKFFLGGVMTYSNEAKAAMIGVDAALIRERGAVSAEVAEQMARGVRSRFASDIGVSITGIAGPDGGTIEKPVGTVFIGIATPDGTFTKKLFFPFDRERVRRYSCFAALDLLRKV